MLRYMSMFLSRKSFIEASILIAGILACTVPFFALAADEYNEACRNCGTAAQCAMRPCGTFLASGKCTPGGVCKADSTSGGPITDIAKLLTAVAQLMTALHPPMPAGGGGGSGSGSGAGTGNGGGGCAQYRTVTTPSADPCDTYIAPAVVNPTSTATGVCDPVSAALGTCTDTAGGTGGTGSGGDKTNATLTANPVSGAPPLSVVFNITDTTVGCSRSAITLNFGDGSEPQTVLDASTACAASVVQPLSHTYKDAGSYNAKLINTATGASLATATIKADGQTQAQTGTQVVQTEGKTDVTGQTAGSQRSDLRPGVKGDIQVMPTGATVQVSAQNQEKTSEVAGFYGSNTYSSQQPTGLVAQWCTARPWASNFLARIIPAGFFDGLCTFRGYQVGKNTEPAVTTVTLRTRPVSASTTAAVLPTTRGATSTIQKPVAGASTSTARTTTTAPKQVTKTKTATSTIVTPSIAPPSDAKADIWATPAAVPLGSRTTVFWNAAGVTSCTESSPDGSFSQNTVSGGAATVPLSAATTFTISCLTPNGGHVTNFFTVKLAY